MCLTYEVVAFSIYLLIFTCVPPLPPVSLFPHSTCLPSSSTMPFLLYLFLPFHFSLPFHFLCLSLTSLFSSLLVSLSYGFPFSSLFRDFFPLSCQSFAYNFPSLVFSSSFFIHYSFQAVLFLLLHHHHHHHHYYHHRHHHHHHHHLLFTLRTPSLFLSLSFSLPFTSSSFPFYFFLSCYNSKIVVLPLIIRHSILLFIHVFIHLSMYLFNCFLNYPPRRSIISSLFFSLFSLYHSLSRSSTFKDSTHSHTPVGHKFIHSLHCL